MYARCFDPESSNELKDFFEEHNMHMPSHPFILVHFKSPLLVDPLSSKLKEMKYPPAEEVEDELKQKRVEEVPSKAWNENELDVCLALPEYRQHLMRKSAAALAVVPRVLPPAATFGLADT